MTKPTISTVAVVGTGVIGRSWAQVFARAGCWTRIYDQDPGQTQNALQWLEETAGRDCAAGLTNAEEAAARRARITAHRGLAEALAGAGYVQESGPEQIDKKKSIFVALDRTANPSAILGSSTSALDMTEIAAGLPGASRCIIAHPVNPPHVIPVVEVLPGRETDAEIVARACAFLASVGQRPVVMNSYIIGFLLNRMQAALVREAINLVESGVAGVDAVDTVVRDGLGLRWALMGPFGVANSNADGGAREYFTRYRQSYIDLMNTLGPTPSFDPDLVERLGQATDAMMGGTPRPEVCRWRDRLVHKIRKLKGEDPQP